MARMTRKRSLTELSRKSRMQFDLSKKVHSSGMGFGQPWLTTFKWAILSPNGSFRDTTVDLKRRRQCRRYSKSVSAWPTTTRRFGVLRASRRKGDRWWASTPQAYRSVLFEGYPKRPTDANDPEQTLSTWRSARRDTSNPGNHARCFSRPMH